MDGTSAGPSRRDQLQRIPTEGQVGDTIYVSEGTARNRALRSSNCPARRWWSLSPECDGPEQSTVRQIRQRLADPLWNGAAIGAGRMSRCLRCGGGGQRRAREYEPAGVRRSQRCDAAVWRPMRCSPQVSAPQSVSGSTPSSGVERPSRQHPTANPRHVSSFAHSSGRTQGRERFDWMVRLTTI